MVLFSLSLAHERIHKSDNFATQRPVSRSPYDRMFNRLPGYVSQMYTNTQSTSIRRAGRFGIRVRTDDQYTTRDPVGWTWEEVADYVTQHAQLFAAQNRLLGVVRDKKLTGRYFVQLDHEGLRDAKNTVLSGDNDLWKDFKVLSERLQHRAKRTSPIQPRSPSVRDIFGGEASPES